MLGIMRNQAASTSLANGRSEGFGTRFFLWNGLALYLGEVRDASEHSHHALQIAVGLNRTFRLSLDGAWESHRMIVISPDRPHRFDGTGDVQAVLLLDPESKTAQRIIREHCHDGGVGAISPEPFERIIGEFREALPYSSEYCDMKSLCDEFLYGLSGADYRCRPLDPRVERALAFMKVLRESKAPLSDVADAVGLSESRLAHLFTEQIGIPVRRYLLWLRLIQAIEQILDNVSFTTAAHSAGFSDSAHLSRTFRRMFGITLSALFKNSRFVQVTSFLK